MMKKAREQAEHPAPLQQRSMKAWELLCGNAEKISILIRSERRPLSLLYGQLAISAKGRISPFLSLGLAVAASTEHLRQTAKKSAIRSFVLVLSRRKA